MSILQCLWGATRDDIVRIGKASRPQIPGRAPKFSSKENERKQVERLERKGPRQMNEAGYVRIQILLQAAQARPAGSAKRIRKEQRVSAQAAKVIAKQKLTL